MNSIAEKALNAYGGREVWTESKRIEAEVSVHGLAFTLKRRPFFKHAKIAMDIARPYSRLTPIGKEAGITGVLDGHDVRLEDQHGEIISERKDARSYFPAGRRLLYWDDLDMAYFANYAFWNYFTLPALLMRTDIQWTEIEPGWLEAIFPDEIPTHNTKQRFRFARAARLYCRNHQQAGNRCPCHSRAYAGSAGNLPLQTDRNPTRPERQSLARTNVDRHHCA